MFLQIEQLALFLNLAPVVERPQCAMRSIGATHKSELARNHLSIQEFGGNAQFDR